MEIEGIKKFIECLVPVSACNLRCEYCYIIQENRRKNKMPVFEYSAEHIGKALSKERLGGVCFISFAGEGETLLPKEIVGIIKEILKQGHFVNITTNGTISNRFDEIIKWPQNLLERLFISFSFHYLELKKEDLLNVFFDNVNKVKEAGCSFFIQFNLYDGYKPYLEEMKQICIEKTGAMPQIAATRDETNTPDIKLHTNGSDVEYKNCAKSFDSKLFEYTLKNFMVKRNEFCYAGKWSFVLNIATGMIRRCYFEKPYMNVYEDLESPIERLPIGNGCRNIYCVNSSHFMSLGIIPELKDEPTYIQLRNRKEGNWTNGSVYNFLDGKLQYNNKEYNYCQKVLINIYNDIKIYLDILKNKCKKLVKEIYYFFKGRNENE